MKITQEMWQVLASAVGKMMEDADQIYQLHAIEAYRERAERACTLVVRYEKGERTPELYKEMMELE